MFDQISMTRSISEYECMLLEQLPHIFALDSHQFGVNLNLINSSPRRCSFGHHVCTEVIFECDECHINTTNGFGIAFQKILKHVNVVDFVLIAYLNGIIINTPTQEYMSVNVLQ